MNIGFRMKLIDKLNLLNFNKDIISPLLRKSNTTWTNFWGAIDETGFYKRSDDYIDIINNKKKGCWNVPYITGVFLIKRIILELKYIYEYKN